MNSFLNRNITTSLFYSNNRNSLQQKSSPSPISRYMSSIDTRNSSRSKTQKIDTTIYNIFKIIYEREFPNILTVNSKLFLQTVNKKSEELILKNLSNTNDISQIKSYIGIGKDKILNLYNEEFSLLNEYYLNYKKNPSDFNFLQDNIIKHCNRKNNKYIYHKCYSNSFGNFISINKKENGLYIICVKCKKCYKNNYINLYCNLCNKEYFGTIYKNIDPKKNNPDLFLATWKYYHCGIFNNEIMKCIKCKNYFYYNIKSNKLICQNKNCNFNPNPEYIIWKCSKCSKEFHSQVKPYNPIEFQVFKKEIYYIILNRNKARPLNIIRCLHCKKIINLDSITFFHNNTCKGELFKGKLFNKDVVSCSKCHFTSYIEDFIWTCPLCNKLLINHNNDKVKNDIDTNNNNIHNNTKNNSSDSKKHRIFYYLRSSYKDINSMRNIFKSEKRKDKINSNNRNNILVKNDYKKEINYLTNKKLSNYLKVKPIRTVFNSDFRTLENDINIKNEKDSLSNLKTDTNIEKDSSIYSLSKYSLNNSNSSCLSHSKNSLQNKDRQAFHSIIMKMKNRMINSKNKFSTEKDEKNNNDQIKNIIDIKNNRRINNISNSTDFDKINQKKRFQLFNKKNISNNKDKNENEKKNEIQKKDESKENNKFISVKLSLSNKDSNNYLFGSKINEIYDNENLIAPMKEVKGFRNRYKEKQKDDNNNNNNIYHYNTENNLYTKDKKIKIGSFYIKSKDTEIKSTRINSKDELTDSINNRDLNKESNKYNNKKNDVIKNYNSLNLNKNDRDTKINKYSLYKRFKKENNINIVKVNENRYANTFNKMNYFKNNEKENDNKNNNNYYGFKRNNLMNKNNTEIHSNKEDDSLSKKISLQPLNYKKISYFNYNSKKSTFITISPSKKEEESNNNVIKTTSNDNEKKPVLSNFKQRTFYKFRFRRQSNNHLNDKNEEKDKDKEKDRDKNNNKDGDKDNNKEEDKDSYKNCTPHQSKSNTYKLNNGTNNDDNNKSSLSFLVKKNLDEFFDKSIAPPVSNFTNLKKGMNTKNALDIKNSDELHKVMDDKNNDNNFENKKDEKNSLETQNNDDSNDTENLDNDEDEDEDEKRDVINELNIKKVIKHFAARKSVVQILREIGNEDNSKKKNIETIKNDHLVLEGLINHVNLISSPEKITLLQQHSIIPIFSDDDYCYYQSIGEGSNANVYLVKDNRTNKEYAIKKMVCQEFNDLVRIKKKLEIINELNHKNLMKVNKIQFKCLDFTTYAINAVMEKAITDWNNEIKQRAKNKNYYTEKELVNIAKQVISGLAFLQENNIAHRDIKPQNILIFPNNVYKVADLGEMIENIKGFDNQLTIRGSERFLSPALKDALMHNRSEVKHNAFKSDVFSLGYCFLYAMSLNIEILEPAREYWGKNKDYVKIEIDIKKYIGDNKYSNKFIDFIGKMIFENENLREDFLGLRKELESF